MDGLNKLFLGAGALFLLAGVALATVPGGSMLTLLSTAGPGAGQDVPGPDQQTGPIDGPATTEQARTSADGADGPDPTRTDHEQDDEQHHDDDERDGDREEDEDEEGRKDEPSHEDEDAERGKTHDDHEDEKGKKGKSKHDGKGKEKGKKHDDDHGNEKEKKGKSHHDSRSPILGGLTIHL